MISLPFAIVVVVATWIFSAGITYGIFKSWKDQTQSRIDHHDEEIQEIKRLYVPRTEHDLGRTDLASRLERIERKIDALK